MNTSLQLSPSHVIAEGPLHLFLALGELKARLFEKYERALPGHRFLIRQAVAEAEALAWQTPFPHLLLPDYAELRVAEALSRSSFAEAA